MKHPRRTDMLTGAAALSLTSFFFVPYSIYLNNTEAFFTDKVTLALLCLLCAVCAFAAVSLVLAALPAKLRVHALALLAFLSTALWVQAYLLNWDYGLLDGSDLAWRFLELRNLVDLGVWTVLLACFWIAGVKKRYSFRTVFAVLILLQAGNLTFLALNSEPAHPAEDEESGDIAIHLTNQFVFSREKNVILMVVDAYQADIFNTYLERHPEYRDKLPGFTYYPDALTEIYFTEYSIPSMLTGARLIRQLFPDGRTFRSTMHETLREQSIPALFKRAGYYVGVYTSYAHRYYPPSIYGSIADNYTEEDLFAPYYAGEMTQIMGMSLFRAMPHMLKKRIHDRWLLDTAFEQDRDVFIHGIDRDMRIGTDLPCFKYYHLQGLHSPQVIEGELLDWLQRDSTLQIAHHVNEMLAQFVAKLRTLGIYDSADILIVGDHGLYWDASGIEPGTLAAEQEQGQPPLDIFVKQPRALPLLLFKPAHAEGPLATSMAPVSLLDIMPTMREIAGTPPESSDQGASLFDLSGNDSRERYYFTNLYRSRLTDPVHEFLVSGFAWHRDSWTCTGNVYKAGEIQRLPLDNHVPETTLTFGRSGTGRQYLDSNWLEGDRAHTVDGGEAGLVLPLASLPLFRPMALRLDVASANSGGGPEGHLLEVYANDVFAGRFFVTERKTLRVEMTDASGWTGPVELPARSFSPDRPWLATRPPLSNTTVALRLVVRGEEFSHDHPSPSVALFSLVIENVFAE